MARHGFPMPRGGGQDLPHARRLSSAKASRHGARAKGFAHARTRPSAKASRHGARAKGFAPRRNTPHGEGLPTRRTSERICPAGFVFAPRADERRAAPDRRTAGKTPLRRGRTRHGARAKRFAPRRNTLLGEGLPTRRTSKRICPAREGSPRRKPPDTAHERKDLPRAGTRPTAKASRHGARAKEFAHARTLSSAKASRHSARAKGFAPRRNALLGKGLPTRRASERICPRENAPLGEGLSTRRTSERICPAQKHSPRRRPPDTAQRQKNLPRARTRPMAKASRHGAKAKGFVRGVRVRPTCRRTAGRPRSTDSQKNTPSAGSHPQRAAAAEFIHRKKIRLLHETQLFYGESHVGSR